MIFGAIIYCWLLQAGMTIIHDFVNAFAVIIIIIIVVIIIITYSTVEIGSTFLHVL